MTVLVANCPRCGAKRMTLDVSQALFIRTSHEYNYRRHWHELFCICRNCTRSTTFVLAQLHRRDEPLFANSGALMQLDRSLNEFVEILSYVSLRDMITENSPEHVPDSIQAVFKEWATCLAVQCWNAAGTMFRMCVDLATRPMLPTGEADGLNAKTRRDLGLRLQWLFQHEYIPAGLRELSTCVREDGNDGAHAGTLTKEDAEDLLDFTRALLERLYTEPERLRLAKQRRKARREVPSASS